MRAEWWRWLSLGGNRTKRFASNKAAELAVAPEPAQRVLAIDLLPSRRPGEPDRSAAFTSGISRSISVAEAMINDAIQSCAKCFAQRPAGRGALPNVGSSASRRQRTS